MRFSTGQQPFDWGVDQHVGAFPARQPTPSVRWQAKRAATAWRRAAVVALLMVAGASLVGCQGGREQPAESPSRKLDDGQAKPADRPPGKFDEATAAAWKKAGAEVGWMGKEEGGFLLFSTKADILAAPVPAFRLRSWPANGIATLPDPARPFGLYLRGAPVTDAVLKELAGLKSLQALTLTGTQVTDAGLKELAGLMALQALDLELTQVTGAGLKELARLKGLQVLCLNDAKVTDAGLRELAGLQSLQSLHLDRAPVTDAGLTGLGGLKNLQILRLDSTQVTDAGLKELTGLQSLQGLYLGRTM
jgi:internalin A